MKIGIDIRNIGKKRTGDEVVFFNLTKNLAQLDDVNEYQLFTDITDKNKITEIAGSLGISDKKNFTIISLRTKNKFSWNFWTIGKYLRYHPVDIYLTQYITPWFVPKKVKIATIIHDISFNFYPQFIKWSDLFFLKTLIPLSLRRADKIIGVSKFTQEEVIKFYKIDSQKVDWIHNAVSEDFLAQDILPEKIKTVKEKYNLPDRFILYIGTLQPRKNLPTLVEAFALIQKDLPDVKLVLAGGKGHNFDQGIEEIIQKNNLDQSVCMPGYIDEEDKAAVIKSAEVFCFPSLYEGFGIPILEAMSLDVPVIISDIPPHHEVAGEAAMFFNSQDSQELAQELQKFFKSSEDENWREKRKMQRQKFSWKNSAEKVLHIFRNLE